jgi:hypothetical protein
MYKKINKKGQNLDKTQNTALRKRFRFQVFKKEQNNTFLISNLARIFLIYDLVNDICCRLQSCFNTLASIMSNRKL